MSAPAALNSVAAPPQRNETAPVWRMLVAQVRSVLIYYRRQPAFFVFSALLPMFFYAMFGLTAGDALPSGATVGALIMAHMGAYSVSSVLVFNIGIGQASRRAEKLDLLQRATPLPPWIAIAADAVGGLVLAGVSLVVLFAFAAVAGGVQLDLAVYPHLLLRLLLGALPVLGIGLTIGFAASASAAPALANIIYLPLAFLSGLFIPLESLPDAIRAVAPFLPTYHYAQLVDGTFGAAREPTGVSILWLAIWGVVLFAAGIRAYRLEQRRKFS
jgi:ABC-2 type transport system permease protein